MIARGATKWVVAAWVPAGIAVFVSTPAGLALLSLPLLVLVFFRDPEREPEGEGIVSPADGRVSVLEDGDGVRVGIFMNLYNVHVNRSPVSGDVVSAEHHDGGHLPAFKKSSETNERRVTRIASDEGEFEVVQIAGAVARRITPYVDEGDAVERGERIGIIAFSSRVDVVFPPEYSLDDIDVEKGDSVRAGETVIA